jgi:hypothetical protein
VPDRRSGEPSSSAAARPSVDPLAQALSAPINSTTSTITTS